MNINELKTIIKIIKEEYKLNPQEQNELIINIIESISEEGVLK